MKIKSCFELLELKNKSHPHLCAMWQSYLLSRKPSQADLHNCVKATKQMETLPDVTPKQAYILYSMLRYFFNP